MSSRLYLYNLSVTGILLPRTPPFACQCERTSRRQRLSQPKLLVEQHKPHGNCRSMKATLIFSLLSCPLYLRVLLVPMKPKTQLMFVAHSQFSYVNTFSSQGARLESPNQDETVQLHPKLLLHFRISARHICTSRHISRRVSSYC